MRVLLARDVFGVAQARRRREGNGDRASRDDLHPMADDPIERLQEPAERWRDYSAVSTAARDQVGAGLSRLRELSEQLSASDDRLSDLESPPETPLEAA